jgi:hypothetical protein
MSSRENWLLSIAFGCLKHQRVLAWIVSAIMLPSFASGLGQPLPEYSFSQLKTLIETENIRSPEKLIEKLPVSLRENYTLMRESKSLQSASVVNPRVILFGYTADFVLTFNGAPDNRKEDRGGYDSIETMEFSRASRSFVFREINFDPSRQSAPTFSEPNPDKCLRCHSEAAQPIWASYKLWPGAFGEVDDGVSSKTGNPRKDGKAATFDDLLNWKLMASHHDRYKHLVQSLPQFPGSQYTFPYYLVDGEKFKVTTPRNLYFRPNYRLSLLLAEKLARSSGRLAIESSTYRPFRYQIGHTCALHVKERAKQGFDDELRLVGLNKLGLTAHHLSLDPDTASTRGYRSGFPPVDPSVGVCKEILNQLVSEDFKLAALVTGPSFDALNGNDYGFVFSTFLDNEQSYRGDPRFMNYLLEKTRSFEITDSILRYLQEMSGDEKLVSPMNTKDDPSIQLEPAIQVFLKNRCISCHDPQGSRSGVGPKIPLSTRLGLQTFLQKKGVEWKKRISDAVDAGNETLTRMPPRGEHLTASELREIQNYMNSLR